MKSTITHSRGSSCPPSFSMLPSQQTDHHVQPSRTSFLFFDPTTNSLLIIVLLNLDEPRAHRPVCLRLTLHTVDANRPFSQLGTAYPASTGKARRVRLPQYWGTSSFICGGVDMEPDGLGLKGYWSGAACRLESQESCCCI